jgi:hypothetical protein
MIEVKTRLLGFLFQNPNMKFGRFTLPTKAAPQATRATLDEWQKTHPRK